MPIDSQLLYYHLALHADDDGVVEAFQVMRMTGASEDNLRVLAAKEFVKVLNDDMVTWIQDWNEHNYIRADRLKPSIYRSLLLQLVPDAELTQPKQRSDVQPKNSNLLSDDREQSGPSMDGVGEERIGEVRVGEGRTDEEVSPASRVTAKRIEKALSEDEKLSDEDESVLQSVLKKITLRKEISASQEDWARDILTKSDSRLAAKYAFEQMRNQPRKPYTVFFDDEGNYLSEEHKRQHKAQEAEYAV